MRRRVLGEEHPDTLDSMNNLALSTRSKASMRRPSHCSPGPGGRRRVLGEEHPETLTTMNNLAELYVNQGKYAQAEPLYTKVLEVRRPRARRGASRHVDQHGQPGMLYRKQGKYAEAEPLLPRSWRFGAACWARSIPTLIGKNALALLYFETTQACSVRGAAPRGSERWPKAVTNTWVRYNWRSIAGGELGGSEEVRGGGTAAASGYAGMRHTKPPSLLPADSKWSKPGDEMIVPYQDGGSRRRRPCGRRSCRRPNGPPLQTDRECLGRRSGDSRGRARRSFHPERSLNAGARRRDWRQSGRAVRQAARSDHWFATHPVASFLLHLRMRRPEAKTVIRRAKMW